MRGESYTMRELEKLKAGLDFCFDDWDIASLKEMPGSVGEEVWIARTFNCDNGKKHIHWQSFFR
jgi:maltose O-acetyltransferase